ncbi:unnamed protein product [Diplocarpon coronariae]|nr:hypothetical protein JHW43_000284 [Diplocarpon mali]
MMRSPINNLQEEPEKAGVTFQATVLASPHAAGSSWRQRLGSLEAEPLAGDAVCGGMSTVRVRGWRLERREAAAIKPGLAIHTTLGLWDKAGLRLQDSCKCRLKDSFSMEISVSPCGQSMQLPASGIADSKRDLANL